MPPTDAPKKRYERLFAWVQRNQRWLSGAFFVFGFLDHIVTFGAFSLSTEIILFEIYLTFTALCMFVAHISYGRAGRTWRMLAIAAPLFAQMTIGGLLAGFVVFYAKESVLSVSWPFLILLGIIFLGTEALRSYREHLVFQTTLFYFSIYAFAIFALPTYVGSLSERIFFESTILSVGVFAVFLLILACFGWKRLTRTLLPILLGCGILTGVVVLAYITDVIPPLPLALHDGGIYHSVVRMDTVYTIQGEQQSSWWHLGPEIVHHVPGTPLYAYSAIVAPGTFSTGVVHDWQQYDEATKTWISRSYIAFSLTGGRENGYRGYTIKADPQPGKWRVRVETLTGQSIGEFRFTVENVPTEPGLTTQSL